MGGRRKKINKEKCIGIEKKIRMLSYGSVIAELLLSVRRNRRVSLVARLGAGTVPGIVLGGLSKNSHVGKRDGFVSPFFFFCSLSRSVSVGSFFSHVGRPTECGRVRCVCAPPTGYLSWSRGSERHSLGMTWRCPMGSRIGAGARRASVDPEKEDDDGTR